MFSEVPETQRWLSQKILRDRQGRRILPIPTQRERRRRDGSIRSGHDLG